MLEEPSRLEYGPNGLRRVRAPSQGLKIGIIITPPSTILLFITKN